MIAAERGGELGAVIRELETNRRTVNDLVDRKLRDAVCRRFSGHTYREIVADPHNAKVLSKLRKGLVAEYATLLDRRLSALRQLCEHET
jgi:hypothetical protein